LPDQPAAAVTGAGQPQTVPLDANATPAAPAHRSILVRTREGYSAVVTTARDGLGDAVDFMAVPASWVQRQISAVQELRW
jgi:hypothetical protein